MSADDAAEVCAQWDYLALCEVLNVTLHEGEAKQSGRVLLPNAARDARAESEQQLQQQQQQQQAKQQEDVEMTAADGKASSSAAQSQLQSQPQSLPAAEKISPKFGRTDLDSVIVERLGLPCTPSALGCAQ